MNTTERKAVDVLAEDSDGMPLGYADWYNRQFCGQIVDTSRDHACEAAWRAGALHDRAAVAELIEADKKFDIAFHAWMNDRNNPVALNALCASADVRAAALASAQGGQ